jgi:hypothetical protein
MSFELIPQGGGDPATAVGIDAAAPVDVFSFTTKGSQSSPE